MRRQRAHRHRVRRGVREVVRRSQGLGVGSLERLGEERRRVVGLEVGGRMEVGEMARGSQLGVEESGHRSGLVEEGEDRRSGLVGEVVGRSGPAGGSGPAEGEEHLGEPRTVAAAGMAVDSPEEEVLAEEHLGEGVHNHHRKAALIIVSMRCRYAGMLTHDLGADTGKTWSRIFNKRSASSQDECGRRVGYK